MFDLYAIRARINPFILFVLPGLLLLSIYAIQLEAFKPWLYSSVVLGAIGVFLSQISRDQGKKREKSLWDEWGGAPSIQLLRWCDGSIPYAIKKRYHDELQRRCPVSHPPDIVFETANPQAADDIYESWCIYLRGKTRDRKNFELLFKENMNYGFRRNLWGMKPAAIIFILISLAGNYWYHYYLFGEFDPRLYNEKFWYASGMLVVFLGIWILIINKNFVRVPAFAYAKRLWESIDQLP